MSVLAGTHSASVSQSQLYSIAGDQVNVTNYNYDWPGSDGSLEQERQKIADWLSVVDFSATQNEIFHKHAEGTGQWLLESKAFEDWRNGTSETLFCSGMPGAGKTALTSIAIDHLQARFGGDDNVAIAYIYLDYKKQAQQSPSDLMSNLLKQFIQIRTADLGDIESLYLRHRDPNTRPTVNDLVKAVNLEISKHSKVFVVIDALDELSEDNGARANFLHALRSLTGPVNLMVTSRKLPSIALYFQDTKHLEIRAHDEDVRKYILTRMPHWYSKRLEETVTDEIVKKADGMFLLARLHMDSLIGKHSPAQVTRTLKNLPMGMEHTYDEAMKRIRHQNEFDRELAYRVLSWITFACRPLSVKELQYALAVAPDMTQLDSEEIIFEECLTSYCAGLVVIDEESLVIRLVHYTAQEYFESRREILFPDAQADITRACLTYLLFDDFGRDYEDDVWNNNLLSENPLLGYAARYWGYHACGNAEEVERALLLKFLQSHHQLVLASRILSMGLSASWYPLTNLSAMHLCAFFGLYITFKHQLESGERPDPIDGHDRTPLFWAAANGHDGIVACLVGQSNVDINSRDAIRYTPLSWAALNGHSTVVRLLLAHESVDVNPKSLRCLTPLSLATENGHGGVVSLLLKHKDIDVNSRSSNGSTPLSLAAYCGHEGIVNLLLTREAIDVNAKDNDGWTPLSYATVRGHTGVMSRLLAHIAVDDNLEGPNSQTPLLLAASKGHREMVQLLLERNSIDINAKDEYGWCPLAVAAWNGYREIVILLLEREAIDVNSKDDESWTPISLAGLHGYSQIVSLLLAHKAIDVNSKDIYGWTPLSRAAERGRDEVVSLLLAHEAVDVNARDNEGRTSLSRAAEAGQKAVVKLFLADQGINYNLNAQDESWWTLLLRAAENGHDSVVRLLFAHGIHRPGLI